jgi:hypothetical protein
VLYRMGSCMQICVRKYDGARLVVCVRVTPRCLVWHGEARLDSGWAGLVWAGLECAELKTTPLS